MFIQQHNFGTKLELKCGHTDGIHNSDDHLHQFFEFEVVLEGEIEITMDGETVTARAGDIAIIPPFRIHSFNTPRYVKQLICVITNSFITDFIPFDEICLKRQTHVFHASEPLWAFIINSDFYNTRTKKNFDPELDRNYIHYLKSVFHLILAEYFNTVPVTGGAIIDNALSRILFYISENFDKDISLEEVGAALGYSPKYVSNCLKALHGFSFRSLVNSLRVEKAKKLLNGTDMLSHEIAEECGFVSQASFHRVFRESVGMTPQKYRTSCKSSC